MIETDGTQGLRSRAPETLRSKKMRRNLFHPGPALAAMGLSILVACGGGDDPTSIGPVPTAPTTTAAPATTTSTPFLVPTTVGPSTTTPPRTTPPTTVQPVRGDASKQVTTTPARAPVGARVTIEGSGFTEENWREPSASLWLVGGPTGCYFFAAAEHSVTVSAAGRLTGSFVVPATGGCRFSTGAETPVEPGRYDVVLQCTACIIGSFEVTPGGPAAPVRCANVGFAPNSDDAASSLVATGLPCAEAEALVRRVGARVGATGGPDRVEQDGFTCVRVGRNDGRGLAASDFECTSGSKRVTFTRT